MAERKNPFDKVPHRVTVICLGNICRSPVAEYLLRKYAQETHIPQLGDIIFDSAGLIGGERDLAPYSREFIEEKGLDSSKFESKPTSRGYFQGFDLILVLENFMKREILQDYYDQDPPEVKAQIAAKIMTLSEAAGSAGDIPDPFGMPYTYYQVILSQIDGFSQDIVNFWRAKVSPANEKL